jgi:hypothetical protein
VSETSDPEPAGVAEAPFREAGASRGHQPWCSRPEVPAGAQVCPECKACQPGNTLSLKHGAFRSLDRPETLGALLAVQADVVEHLGGDPSVIQLGLAKDYSRVDAMVEAVAANIAAGGILTPKGRRRAAVTLLLALMDRRLKLAAALGLERRAKPVASPLDYITGKADL